MPMPVTYRQPAAGEGFLRWLGPMFYKEARVASRRGRTFWLRIAYVTALALYTGVVFRGITVGATSVSDYGMRMAQVGREVVAHVVLFQFFAAQIVAVVIMSTSLNGELERRTLMPLLSTPISPRQILLGKLAGGLLELLLLLATSLPVLALVRIFGGIDWIIPLSGLLAVMLTALGNGLLAMAISARWRHGGGSTLLALVAAGAWTPLAAPLMFSVFGHEHLIFWCSALLVGAGAIPIFWMLACRNFNQMIEQQVGRPHERHLHKAQQAEPALRRMSAEAVVAAPAAKAAPAPPKARALADVGRWPLWWLAWRRLGGIGHPAALAGVAAAVAVLVLDLVCWRGFTTDLRLHSVVLPALTGLAAGVVAIISAAAVSCDLESQQWLVLLTLPQGRWRLLLTRGAVALVAAGPLLLLLVLHPLPLVLLGARPWSFLAELLAMALAGIVFAGSLGMYLSGRTGRTGRASLLTFGLLAAGWLLLPHLATLAERGLELPAGSLRSWAELPNPLAHVSDLARGEIRSNWPLPQWLARLAVEGGYLALSAALVALAARRLRRPE